MKKLGFGMMRLPKENEDDPESIKQEEVNQMVKVYMNAGYNYFDTAYVYPGSEVSLRKAVTDQYVREDVVIADKLPLMVITKEEQLESIFQEQLDRTGAEYFDYYLLHNVSGYSTAGFENVPSFKFARNKKEEGKIKKLGFSSHANAEYIEKIIKENPDFEFVQLQINYLDWENEQIDSKKCYELACKYNLPVIVMEPLKGGFLANVPDDARKLMEDYNGQSPVEWAFRFLAGLENVECVLSGSSSLKQLEENIEFFKNIKPLNDEELEILDKVRKIINDQIEIDCTKCGYCLSSCPEKILIPKLFDIYNNDMIEGIDGWTAIGNEYLNYAKKGDHGLASDCIECGACISQCPQHINIPEELKKVATRFEIPIYKFDTN